MTLKFGLAGAGKWGKNFIRTFHDVSGAEIDRIFTHNPDNPDLSEYGLPLLDDWDRFLDESRDGIIIASPPQVHYAQVKSAVETGKPVLVEKPLTLDLTEAERLHKLHEKHGTLVMVDHIQIYQPGFIELKHLVSPDTVRKIETFGGNRGPFRNFSPLWDYAPHDLSMCIDLMAGNVPTPLSCRILRQDDHSPVPGGLYEIDLKFHDGPHCHILTGNLADEKTRLFRVLTSDCWYEINSLAAHPLKKFFPAAPTFPTTPERVEIIPVNDVPPLTVAVNEFVNSVQTGTPVRSDLAMGVTIVELLTEIENNIR